MIYFAIVVTCFLGDYLLLPCVYECLSLSMTENENFVLVKLFGFLKESKCKALKERKMECLMALNDL